MPVGPVSRECLPSLIARHTAKSIAGWPTTSWIDSAGVASPASTTGSEISLPFGSQQVKSFPSSVSSMRQLRSFGSATFFGAGFALPVASP